MLSIEEVKKVIYALIMEKLLKILLKHRLPKDFFEKETTLVAKNLLGKLLISYHKNTLLIGMIVETEAYRSDDPASHAYRWKTNRNSAMFGPVGHAYVYINYGIHYGFNVVARDKELAAGGVLIRAVEPLHGIEGMKKNRSFSLKNLSLTHLTNGPGKLTQAFGITKKYNHHNLIDSRELFITEDILNHPQRHILAESHRIGISKAKDHLWRFYIKDNPFISHSLKPRS